MKRSGDPLEKVEKKRICRADSTKCEEKKHANKERFDEITTKGRKIMPLNIIKYKGCIQPPRDHHRWRTLFGRINKHIPSRSHANKEDAEQHIKLMNEQYNLAIRNIVYEYKNDFYCVLTKYQLMKFALHNIDYVEQHNWSAQYNACTDSYYASTVVGRGSIKFQSLVCVGTIGRQFTIDHINRDTLDNEPSNLRLVSACIQAINRKISTRNISGVRGVHYDKNKDVYVASWSEKQRRCFKFFPVNVNGKEQAFVMAVDFRRNKENTISEYQEALSMEI